MAAYLEAAYREIKKEPSVSEHLVGEQPFVRLVGERRNKLLQYRQQFCNKYGHPQYQVPQFKWPARNAKRSFGGQATIFS